MKHLIIIGGGLLGLSCARSALKAGHRVTLLEQGPLPNPQGASYDRHRLIRYQYGTARGYTRMVGEAFAAWNRVWTDLGVSHFRRTGALGVSLEAGDYTDQSWRTFRDLGIAHERLEGAEVERLCPQLTLPEAAWGLLNPDGGVLFADRILDGLLALSRSRGAALRENCRVTGLDADRACVRLQDGREVAGDALVVAAGAWLPALLDDHAALPTYRQAVCYVEPPAADRASWQTGPCLTDLGPGDNYALPPVQGAGLKFGSGRHRRSGVPADGFAADREEGRAIIAAFAPYLRRASAYQALRMAVGYYVKDSSERFRIAQRGKCLVITNCDGQMFKFGPLIGEQVVAAIDGSIGAGAIAAWAAGQGRPADARP